MSLKKEKRLRELLIGIVREQQKETQYSDNYGFILIVKNMNEMIKFKTTVVVSN